MSLKSWEFHVKTISNLNPNFINDAFKVKSSQRRPRDKNRQS